MKMLFWTVFIGLGIVWLLKRNLGAGNDLTAHFQEQTALQNIGNTSLGANQVGQGNWPLSTIGITPLAGLNIDPFNPNNPFSAPHDLILNAAYPSASVPPNVFAGS